MLSKSTEGGNRSLLSQGESTFMGHKACIPQQQELGLGVQCYPQL